MGLAASQARLLSITSRLADNELKSQTINNAKMRLSSETSQVSADYLNALNNANLMFTNYDAFGNEQNQLLTFNSLMGYSPYNNQYGLINSSGQILVSEADAEAYEAAHGDLNTFLSNKGLIFDTSYFSHLNIENFKNPDLDYGVYSYFYGMDDDEIVERLQEMYEESESYVSSAEYNEFYNSYNSFASLYTNVQEAVRGSFITTMTSGSSLNNNNKLIYEYGQFKFGNSSEKTANDCLTMLYNIVNPSLTTASTSWSVPYLYSKNYISKDTYDTIKDYVSDIYQSGTSTLYEDYGRSYLETRSVDATYTIGGINTNTYTFKCSTPSANSTVLYEVDPGDDEDTEVIATYSDIQLPGLSIQVLTPKGATGFTGDEIVTDIYLYGYNPVYSTSDKMWHVREELPGESDTLDKYSDTIRDEYEADYLNQLAQGSGSATYDPSRRKVVVNTGEGGTNDDHTTYWRTNTDFKYYLRLYDEDNFSEGRDYRLHQSRTGSYVCISNGLDSNGNEQEFSFACSGYTDDGDPEYMIDDGALDVTKTSGMSYPIKLKDILNNLYVAKTVYLGADYDAFEPGYLTDSISYYFTREKYNPVGLEDSEFSYQTVSGSEAQTIEEHLTEYTDDFFLPGLKILCDENNKVKSLEIDDAYKGLYSLDINNLSSYSIATYKTDYLTLEDNNQFSYYKTTHTTSSTSSSVEVIHDTNKITENNFQDLFTNHACYLQDFINALRYDGDLGIGTSSDEKVGYRFSGFDNVDGEDAFSIQAGVSYGGTEAVNKFFNDILQDIYGYILDNINLETYANDSSRLSLPVSFGDYTTARNRYVSNIFDNTVKLHPAKNKAEFAGKTSSEIMTALISKGDVTATDLASMENIIYYADMYGLKFSKEFDVILRDYIINDFMIPYFGEPSYSWQDISDSYNLDPNKDAWTEAATDEKNTTNPNIKVTWYSNLFNRMQQGYKVLEDGLASSADWLEFALESGTISMEQINSSNAWASIDYKSCSKITEKTVDETAVAIAEAKYTRAMNDIQTKDKIYDLQLKNLDTEHSALQTEYDSVKKAMDKNIERTMKFDQNG